MKNTIYRILISAFLFLYGTELKAQEGFWYGFSLGSQNTYLSSWLKSDIDSKNAIRPFGSVDFEYRFSPKFALQTGLGYTLFTQNTNSFKNNFNYLTIPVLYRGGSFKKDRRFAVSYYCGINNNFLLSAQNKYLDEKNDINEYTNKFHQELVLGLGIKHEIRENLILESHLIGSVGMQSINKLSTDGFSLINMNYGIKFSLKYQVKKKP